VQRIRESNNARFNFLRDGDPYKPYFDWRYKEHREGRTSKEAQGGKQSLTETEKAGSDLVKPEKLDFSIHIPPVSAMDLAIVKLTALYTARNGHQFLNGLGQRDHRIYQFEFLKPNHSLYGLFQGLVEQYKKIIKPTQSMTERIQVGAENKHDVLARAAKRAEWQAHELEEQRKATEDAKNEQIAFAQIDWHSFILAETIEFNEEDYSADLPPPLSLSQLQFASLEQKRTGQYRLEEAPPDFEPSELPSRRPQVPQAVGDRQDHRQHKDREPSQMVQRPTTTPPPQPPTGPSIGIKVKAAGTSRLDKLRGPGEKMVQSPYTGQMIPESEFNEHMRIMSLDPKWKEQKAVEDSRASTSNLALADVETNLKRLRSAHPDLYDSEGGQPAEDADESNRAKRIREEVQWDGHSSTKEKVRMKSRSKRALQEHQREVQRQQEAESRIGPKK
jgi:splicing factor 3A subunit 1